MATYNPLDQESNQEKTEEPTEERLREFRKQGRILSPQEFLSAFVFLLVALTLILLFKKSSLLKDFQSQWQEIWSPKSFQQKNHPENLKGMGLWILKGLTLATTFLWISCGTLGATFTQFYFNWELLLPRLSRLKKGFSQIKLQPFLRSLLKGFLFSLLVFFAIKNFFQQAPYFPFKVPQALWKESFQHFQNLLIIFSSFLFFFASFETFLNWLGLKKDLRMSRQDIKEEQKKTEGDSQMKAKRKRLARSLAYKNLKHLHQANFIITNPTHYAIALRYQTNLKAPLVVAKGKDELAQTIREYAQKENLPIVEDPPLARKLYAQAPLAQVIAPGFYSDVIRVIRTIYQLKGWDYFLEDEKKLFQ